MRELKKTLSGIRGLDELTNGGLPAGRTTLVCGGPGCGKTLLAATFLVQGARVHNEGGVFISFDERLVDLAANFASLGFDFDGLQRRNLLAMDHVLLDRQQMQEAGDYDLEALFVRINHAIEKVHAKRVVLDSIDSLFAGIPNPAIVRSELSRLFNWLKDRDVTAIITAERGESGITRHGIEEYVSDCVIVLDHRVIEQLSTRRMRVVKYRGTVHGTNEYPFLIDQDGLTVLPVTSLGLGHVVSDERVSSGIASLDAMLEGKGYYKGSSVLLGGGPGTGKTSIAAHFAEATCRRGERCTIFCFEESASQLVRNAHSIGIDVKPWIEKGLLHCLAARPSFHGLELHLSLMLKEIEDHKPSVVIVDPITALSSSGTVSQTKVMLLRLIDHFKMLGITALFTALQAEHDGSEMEVSSLMDTWMVVQNVRRTSDLQRHLFVVKSRGMAHSPEVREFKITNEGVKIFGLPQQAEIRT